METNPHLNSSHYVTTKPDTRNTYQFQRVQLYRCDFIEGIVHITEFTGCEDYPNKGIGHSQGYMKI